MSNADAASSSPIRFAAFEVDVRAGELRNAGVRVPLQQQPFRVLTHLLEHAGDIVTRDELRRKLWTDDTFVDFEHGLNVAIGRIREALGDEADHPQFVETLPKRGYRFIAPVTRDVSADREPVRRRVHAWAAVGVVLALVAVIGVFQARGRPTLTDRDTILVADFVNKTAEDVFDGALKQALTIQLEQTPFLSVVSGDRVRQTLKLMTRSADERVTGALAHEVCQRADARMSIDGTIAAFGRRYVIGLAAIACDSGDSVANVQTDAASREQILNALGAAALRLRQKLGESQATLRRFNAPLEQVTTASLDALKAYTVAEEMYEHGSADPGPPFQRAVDLDPNFAMAHAKLAAVYENFGDHAQSMLHASRAYALRDRTSERERFYIDSRYCIAKEHDRDCMVNVQESWIRTYPRDWLPYDNMAAASLSRGEDAKAAEYARRSVQLNPDSGWGPLHLLYALFALNRFEEAAQVSRDAIARSDEPEDHAFLRLIAFVKNNRTALATERQKELTYEGSLWRAEVRKEDAELAAFQGRMKEAGRILTASAEPGTGLTADQYGRQRALGAVYETAVGEYGAGLAMVSSLLPVAGASRPFEAAMLTMAAALARDRVRVETLLRSADVPPDGSVLKAVVDPLLRIDAGDAAAANRIPPPVPMDLTRLPYRGSISRGSPLVYLRGIAYLRARDGQRAVGEFQRIIDHRGLAPASPLYPLAYVQQARAYVLLGETAKARKDYEAFFEFWRDADPDVPILKEAKAEYAKVVK